MKAIIPVAGAGTRLRPHTYTQPKPLIPVAGKPIISYMLEQLDKAGIDEYIFIIGYLGEKIQTYVEERYPKLKKTFVQQVERQGLGHAIWTAKDVVGEDEVFIVLGDTIFDVDMNLFLQEPHSCLGVKKVEDPRNFGVAEINTKNEVLRVIEKPRIPKSNMALVGLYKIKETQKLIEALEYNIKNDLRSHGEYQLTDGMMRMIEQGIPFKALEINNWFDCGKKDILLETNAMMLKSQKTKTIKDDAFKNTILIQPVSIGENCSIQNSIIGPNVTVGDNVRVDYSIIKHSIIGDYAAIQDVVLHESVVGSDASIKGLSQSLNIGDNTEIDFS